MAITRVTAIWTGFSGAPGYSNFFFNAFGGGDEVTLEVERVRAFFQAIRDLLPSAVNIQVQQEAAILEESSGALIDYAQAEAPAQPVIGGTSANYSGPAGATVTWNTDAVARGRRLRGRTFLVPLAVSAYDPQGTLTNNTITTINGAADLLYAQGDGPELVIWSRPRDGAGGSIGAVTSHRVADQAAVLRSRRD